MVAATFPNLSFENPPGTGPTLLSASSEPYGLANSDLLELKFGGISYSVIFLSADFANIASATATEVASVIEAQVSDLGASNDGGQIRLTSLLTGEDVELEVLGGSANVEFGFPAGPVSGETYAGGPPDGWVVTSDTDSVNQWAEFADENIRPEEIFDIDGWISVALVGGFDDAIFDVLTLPSPFETFNAWSAYGFLDSIVSEQASFDGGLLFDGFESGWGLPVYFAFTPANLTDAPVNPEDYETGWLNGPTGNIGPDTSFANGTKTAEDFANVLDWAFVVSIDSSADGFWTVHVNGVPFTYESSGNTQAQIASILAALVDGGLADVQSVAVVEKIYIGPDPGDRDVDFVVTVTGPSISVVEARDYPVFAEEWIAQDRTQDFN